MALIHFLQAIVNFVCKPQYFVPLVAIALFTALYSRWPWTGKGGATMIGAVAVFFFISYFDPNFKKVASAPDNVPIVGMIFLVGFFFWYAMHHAYENDRRIAAGLPTVEGQDSAQKVFSWPDQV
jgi:signal transduction histidine kinase